ncbi:MULTISPECIES: ATP-binding protein [unclassified Chitinophaga]|uniref:ATP-binding protein n=1 Tax=unclassified Chitinophaga TaxID=2619133 RepID=UPI0030104AC6
MIKDHLKYLHGILLLMALTGSMTALAQTDNFRQLHEKLQQEKDSAKYVKLLNSLSFYHHRNNLDSCFWYATKALEIALRRQDEKGKSYAYTNFALFYTKKRNLKLAIIYNYRALEIDYALSDSANISIDLSNLALAYRAEGNLGKAQEYEQRSLQLGSKYPELGDYKVDLINYLEYYWNNPAKIDSVKWALRELHTISSKKPYSMEWYESRIYETLTSIKTKPFRQIEKQLKDLAADAYRRGLPDESLTAYVLMLRDVLPMGYDVDSIAYAEKIFLLAKEIGDDEVIMKMIPKLYKHYLPGKDWRRIALYGASIRQLAMFEQSEAGKLPVVDHISYFLKEQEMQELQIASQLQQHAIEQSNLQRTSHRILLIFLLALLILLLIFTAIYCFSYYAYRRHTRALAALNAGITEKNIRLQAGDDFKNRLLSLIAHDFRAPINDILHTARLWQRGTNNQRAMLNSIGRVELDSRRTLDNFDGILRWIKSQFSDFAYHPVPCDINEMIAEIIAGIEAEAGNQSPRITTSIPDATVVAADAEMLQFVHRTILRQLITLTGNNGTIDIQVQQHAGQTTFTATGSPIAVTPPLLRLLDLPQQEDKLILVTCKDFMNKMGGSLQVKSDKPDTFAFIYQL